MRVIGLLSLVLLMRPISLQAQWDFTSSPFQAERPMESISSAVVPAGQMQIEAGGYAQWFTPTDAQVPDFSYAVPIGLLRFGWKERVELRVGAQWSQSLGESQQAKVGFKWNLLSPKNGLGISLNTEFETSLAEPLSWEKQIPMDLRLCVDWDTFERWSIRSNLQLYSGRIGWSAAAIRATGRQGWSIMAETHWVPLRGWNIHAGAFLAINDKSRFDFTYFREFQPDMVQIRFGYSRQILHGNKLF